MNKLKADYIVIERIIQSRKASLVKITELAKPKFKKNLRVCKTLNGSKATLREAKMENADSFQPEVVPIDCLNPIKKNTIIETEFKGSYLEESRKPTTIRGYSPTGNLKELPLSRHNLVKFVRYL